MRVGYSQCMWATITLLYFPHPHQANTVAGVYIEESDLSKYEQPNHSEWHLKVDGLIDPRARAQLPPSQW